MQYDCKIWHNNLSYVGEIEICFHKFPDKNGYDIVCKHCETLLRCGVMKE